MTRRKKAFMLLMQVLHNSHTCLSRVLSHTHHAPKETGLYPLLKRLILTHILQSDTIEG